jgi:hypothetical protein
MHDFVPKDDGELVTHAEVDPIAGASIDAGVLLDRASLRDREIGRSEIASIS